MKKPFFCAVAAEQSGESLVGTAGHYQTYVLIECPLPWAPQVFDTERIPPALRQFVKETESKGTIRFLCINSGRPVTDRKTTVLVYERSEETDDFSNSFSSGYDGYEFKVDGLDQVALALQRHWQKPRAIASISHIQDILVCTHGMRDRCCARFGQPFFREVKRLTDSRQLLNVRAWKVSHIGGHRFAPTAITFPDGRYYGRLTLQSLQALINRSGNIAQIRPVYRGWGILPAPLQVLERQLMLSHGWDWFDYRISYQLLAAESSQGSLSAKVTLQPRARQPCERAKTYHARLIRDAQQVHYLKASCSAARPSLFVKYSVASCRLQANDLPSDLPSLRQNILESKSVQ